MRPSLHPTLALTKVTAVSLLAVFVMTGCAQKHSPAEVPLPDNEAQAGTAGNTAQALKLLWGLWDVMMKKPGTFEIVPMRGAQYTVNVNQFLQPPHGSLSNLAISVVNDSQFYSAGRIVVDVTLAHPFPAYPEYAGFDVLGVFIHKGGYTARHDSGVKYAKPGVDAILSNADGYTRWMNPTEFPSAGLGGFTPGALGNKNVNWTATINPYKYFCDGLSATANVLSYYQSPLSVEQRGVFRAGHSNTRRYDIVFPKTGSNPAVTFQYAVVASWLEPQHIPPTDVPGDFPAAANMREPIFITASTEGSTTYWNSSTDRGGNLVLTLEIVDQGGDNNPQGVAGEISEIIVESPNDFIPGSHMLTFTSADWTTSAGSSPMSQKFVLDCGEVVPQGPNAVDNPVLIAVTSVLGSYDTGCATPHPSAPLRAFQRFYIPLAGSPPPEAPGDVTGFSASDADPSLSQHQVKLTWDSTPNAEEYEIQRQDYNTVSKSWYWSSIYTALAGQTSYIDNNARYSGPKNPIKYRIKAVNEYGESPSWAQDTGYPKLRGVKMAFWSVSGNGVTWSRAQADLADAVAFWNGYGFDFSIKNSGGFFPIYNSAYLDLTGLEDLMMHGAYGSAQHPDAINVYYVRSADGSYSMGYCMAYCPGSEHNTKNIFIVLCRDTRNCGGGYELSISLPHELGHAMTRFWDVYLMDTNGDLIMNDGTNCSINTWCGNPYMYCDEAATYPQNPGAGGKVPRNLMWYSFCGAPTSEYDLTVGQFIEASSWMRSHESGYPLP